MRASVLWTGGKDSALALHKARLAGHEIVNLLTFVPPKADFLAHPVSFMKYQAEAIGMPHIEVIIDSPIEDAYEDAIRYFRKKYKVGALITGDIAEVDGLPNWIRQRSVNSNIEVLTPLWGADRCRILSELISLKFKVIFSCIKRPWLTAEWLNREIDTAARDELCKISAKTGLDMCGENGEYHTLVLDGPMFKKPIAIKKYSIGTKGNLSYIKFAVRLLRPPTAGSQ